MKSTSSAVWTGDLKKGKGLISTTSATLKDAPFTFATRFEGAPGTNPEELIAAAHAGCFSMALSSELGKAGFTPTRIATKATVNLDFIDGKPTIDKIQLELTAKVPGIDPAKFEAIAAGAKAGCPVSRLFKAEITLTATLEA